MRKNHKIIFVLTFVCLIFACSNNENSADYQTQKKFSPPLDWKQINEFSIEFFIPPDFLEKKKPHIGGDIKFYENENVWIVLSVQQNSANIEKFSNENDFRLEKVFIDGKQAEIFTFTGKDMVNEAEGKNYVAVLNIPEIQRNGKNLLIWSYSKTQEDREVMQRVFKSVKFSQ